VSNWIYVDGDGFLHASSDLTHGERYIPEARLEPYRELLWRWLDQYAAAGLGPVARLSQDTLDLAGMPPADWTAPQPAPKTP
jgi:hypothetical protein